MKTVDHELVQLALDRVDGDRFELFAQAFMAAMLGSEFMPLGGKKDGGADGAVQAGLYEGKSNFMQASIQEDYRRKIRDTVGRLHEVGREPASLIYCTSRTVPLLDKEAQTLSNELGVSVQIRDQRYIISQINAAPQTVQAFETYLKPHLAFLNQIGGATLVEASLTREIPARALCVFLGQEVDRRRGNTQLLEAVTDSLILWALEETDPAKEVFMTRDEMLAKIEETLPNAVAFVRGTIDNRLAILSSKGGANGREIRHHKKGNKFCLAFETRRLVYQQNAEDETLKAQVTTLFIDRAAQVGGANIAEVVAEVCHRALNITFERQGLEVAAFLDASRTDEVERITISDNIDLALEQMRVPIAERGGIKSAAMLVLRKTFYESSEVERRYLVKLSRTYALLFTLKSEPRVVEYFRGMSSNFVLYVGSDLIVRALSERFLNPDDQMTHNLFKILKAAGSELILTEAALTELLTHLQAQDLEFTNNYQSVERELSLDFVRHIGRLLIRAYFYARLDPEPGQERPRDWPSFIEQFSSYPDLHKAGGRDSLRRTLLEEFDFTFEHDEETHRGVDDEELDALAGELLKVRPKKEKGAILAANDALHIMRVYAKRRELGEASRGNPYGYRTWWLTQATSALAATKDLVKRKGAAYMMLPEFLLNFISLNPSMEEVQRNFEKVFPSLLGVKLSNRMRDEVFTLVVDRVRQVGALGEGRARALLAELSDKLKGDNYLAYEAELWKNAKATKRGSVSKDAPRSSQ